MNRPRLPNCAGTAIVALSISAWAQTGTQTKKPGNPQTAAGPKEFGKSYETLRPEQKRLVDDFVQRYNSTTGQRIVAESAYDGARLSVRTTFDAVTHALLAAKLTDKEGKSLARAIDIVEVVDEIAGEEDGAGGDRQFRLYVYLKPDAFDILTNSREFERERDNTTYHKGFPTCFRLKNGPPSIQVSISRDRRMADIDVDYRSSALPKVLFTGHLTAANSDVRAGDNLDRHDRRWQGLNGWWRQIFGFSLDSSAKPKNKESREAGTVPLNPAVESDQGVDAAVHDFLKSWMVDRRPNNAIAYFSRRSYPCVEEMARKTPLGMIRVQLRMGMEKYLATVGPVTSVGEAAEAVENWKPALKEARNSYAKEFRLVSMPPDMGREEECVPASINENGKTKEKYYAAAFRGTKGDSRNRVMSLLWVEEGHYWKIAAIRIEDSNDAGMTPKKAAPEPSTAVAEAAKYAGDPKVVKDTTDFYQAWVVNRDVGKAFGYVSEKSYQCMVPPLASTKKSTTKPADRLRVVLARPIAKVPEGPNLAALMSSVQPVNELVRPVEHQNSKAFAIMAIPDQMAGSFMCQSRRPPESTPDLKPSEATYGTYYLTASRLNYGDEESPALLILWTHETERWMAVAWAVEVP